MDEAYQEKFDQLPSDCSHLYLAMDQKLAAVVNSLKKAGIRKVVMMTGDSERQYRNRGGRRNQ